MPFKTKYKQFYLCAWKTLGFENKLKFRTEIVKLEKTKINAILHCIY